MEPGEDRQLLSRLRREHPVTTFWQESDEVRPRRYYQLRPEGRHALAAFTQDWDRFRGGVDSLLTGRRQWSP